MIIDTLLFNRDFETLKIRLEELYEVVDLFVICESKYTFTGIPKPLYLSENINNFKKYNDKIRIVVENRKHLTKIPFIREIHQRKAISKYITKLKINKSDTIIYSDCDEIPRASIISSLKNNSNCNVLLEMRNFTNYLNMELGVWTRARVVSGKNYRSIENLRQDIFLFSLSGRKGVKKYLTRVPYYWTTRNFYLWKLPKFFLPKKLEVIKNSGWHFNNLFSRNQIISKLKESAHTELNTNNAAKIANKNYLSGKDIYFGRQYQKVQIDDSYPKSIYTNVSAWSNFIFN